MQAWFQCFSTHLEHLGFVASKTETSLFMYFHGSTTIYLLIYVDDILVTGNIGSHYSANSRFEPLIFYERSWSLALLLGHGSGMDLHRPAFISIQIDPGSIDTHKDVRLQTIANSCCWWLSVKHNGDPLYDVFEYHSVVGALQYLTFTSPNIAFFVNQSTSDDGLVYKPSSLSLTAYADADYASDPDDRHSTGGYYAYLCDNLVS
ncbi:PREDICTED: uncharacterized mitochondrial protein AtMg00810-like [Prunus mume]|uniref:Uncharacterized mitochondrial protein AtMg00810-like n=1 Tax=Prunus mume TaxID=102107 RepID=A0ABM1LI65_PRUMU|nr:PREDICTED: uncharacterized mitochondrial protein AtMg00810-like [Prunus mume]